MDFAQRLSYPWILGLHEVFYTFSKFKNCYLLNSIVVHKSILGVFKYLQNPIILVLYSFESDTCSQDNCAHFYCINNTDTIDRRDNYYL